MGTLHEVFEWGDFHSSRMSALEMYFKRGVIYSIKFPRLTQIFLNAQTPRAERVYSKPREMRLPGVVRKACKHQVGSRLQCMMKLEQGFAVFARL